MPWVWFVSNHRWVWLFPSSPVFPIAHCGFWCGLCTVQESGEGSESWETLTKGRSRFRCWLSSKACVVLGKAL